MTDIICNWLNSKVQLSRPVDPSTVADEFASGYLLGELLAKYGLQHDFDEFNPSKTSDAKLNNFTRVEGKMALLGVPFNAKIAKDVMSGQEETTTKLLYQLYIALENKRKNQLTDVAMETMRPSAPAKLAAMESVLYTDRVKKLTPRQSDMSIQQLVSRFQARQKDFERWAEKGKFEEEDELRQRLDNERKRLINRNKEIHAEREAIVAKLRAAIVQIPEAPPDQTLAAMKRRQELQREIEAQQAMMDIDTFEQVRADSFIGVDDDVHAATDRETPSVAIEDAPEPIDINLLDFTIPVGADKQDLRRIRPNDAYINSIRKRLQDDAKARAEREKRRRKVMTDQLEVATNELDERRNEEMESRLWRQSQMEKRIVVQLMQVHHEKMAIMQNRWYREKQYDEARQRTYFEAVTLEQRMADEALLEYEEDVKTQKLIHERMLTDSNENRYASNYVMCSHIVRELLFLVDKVAQYREMNSKELPVKINRELVTLFVNGCIADEDEPRADRSERMDRVHTPVPLFNVPPPSDLKERREQLLGALDYTEFTRADGEWSVVEGDKPLEPPRSNNVLGHLVHRLYELVHPPPVFPKKTVLPPFPIKVCAIGKQFSGKTTAVQRLASEMNLDIIDLDALIAAAIAAFKAGETMEETVLVELRQPTTETLPVDGATATEQPTAREDVASAQAGLSLASEPNSAEAGLETQAPGEPQPAPAPPEPQFVTEIRVVPTVRALLGQKICECVPSGAPLDDALMVDLYADAIKHLSGERGFVLNNFPCTLNQAVLLERALTGLDLQVTDGLDGLTMHYELQYDPVSEAEKPLLVQNPHASSPLPTPTSVFDLAVFFDLDDLVCLKRASGRQMTVDSGKTFHVAFEPPPEGSYTGFNGCEMVKAYDYEQIQNRLVKFGESWPQLERLFNKFGILKRLDSDYDFNIVYDQLKSLFEGTIQAMRQRELDAIEAAAAKLRAEEEAKRQAEAALAAEMQRRLDELAAQQAAAAATPPPDAGKKKGRASRGSSKGSRGGSRPTSASRSKSPKDKDGKKKDAKKPSSGKGSRKASPGSKSPKGKKADEAAAAVATADSSAQQTARPPDPGCSDWQFVDNQIELELAKIIFDYWHVCEEVYVKDCKHVFKNLRELRDQLLRHMHRIKQDLLAYMNRPDVKQLYVSQFQKEYNDFPSDLREDREAKAELHQRADDLLQRVLQICSERKQENEERHAQLLKSGWYDDYVSMTINAYVSLMQCELDRFQDTIRVLKDYYTTMNGQLVEEARTEYFRLPLLELPVEERLLPEGTVQPPEPSPVPPPPITVKEPTTPTVVAEASAKSKGGKSPRSHSPKAKSPGASRSTTPSRQRSSSASRRSKATQQQRTARTPDSDKDDSKRARVPLIPVASRQGDLKEFFRVGKLAIGKDAKGKKLEMPELPPEPTDADEKVLYEAYCASWLYVFLTINELKQLEEEQGGGAEEKAAKGKAADKGGKKEAPKKGGKGSRTPSPKKGAKKEAAPAPQEPSAAENEEVKRKQEMKRKLHEEMLFALQEVLQEMNLRLRLIKSVGLSVVTGTKQRAGGLSSQMTDVLSGRFEREVGAAQRLADVIHDAVERKHKLREELRLFDDQFLIDLDTIVCMSPPPPVEAIPVVEVVPPYVFTINQLKSLHLQLATVSSNRLLSIKSFVQNLFDLSAQALGTEQLPESLCNLTISQVRTLATMLSHDGEYVDTLRFLLVASRPWPTANMAQLFSSLANFRDVDQLCTGYVSREQYHFIKLWLNSGSSSNANSNLKDRYSSLSAQMSMAPVPPSVTAPVRAGNPTRHSSLRSATGVRSNLASLREDTTYSRNTDEPSPHAQPHVQISPAQYEERLQHFKQLLFDFFAIASENRLDYMNMLMYFCCSTDAYEGFLRAISIASVAHLVAADDPSPQVSVQKLSADYLDLDVNKDGFLVPVTALHYVLTRGQPTKLEVTRFGEARDADDAYSLDRLRHVYEELSGDDAESIPLRLLLQHPLTSDLIQRCSVYRMVDNPTLLGSLGIGEASAMDSRVEGAASQVDVTIVK